MEGQKRKRDQIKEVLVWDAPTAWLLAISAVPAVLFAIFYNPKLGLAGLVGMLPTLFSGVAPKRKERISIVVLGLVIALCIFAGTVIKVHLGGGAAGIFMAVIGFLASLMMKKGRMMGILFIVPIVGIGMSFTSMQISQEIFILMTGGTLLNYLIALCFPEFEGQEKQKAAPLPQEAAVIYGICYAAALALATWIGFHWDHTGWVVGSTALVMRPSLQMQKSRSFWRVISVLIGTTSVSLLMLAGPGIGVIAVLSAAMLVAGGGLHKSKRYIMPMFISYVMFSMMLYPVTEGDIVWMRLFERVLWVLTGVLIAFVFGVLSRYRMLRKGIE